MSKKETPDKKKAQDSQPQVRKLYGLSEKTYNELTKFLEMCPYGQVKHLIKGVESAIPVNVEIVPDKNENGQVKPKEKSAKKG